MRPPCAGRRPWSSMRPSAGGWPSLPPRCCASTAASPRGSTHEEEALVYASPCIRAVPPASTATGTRSTVGDAGPCAACGRT